MLAACAGAAHGRQPQGESGVLRIGPAPWGEAEAFP